MSPFPLDQVIAFEKPPEDQWKPVIFGLIGTGIATLAFSHSSGVFNISTLKVVAVLLAIGFIVTVAPRFLPIARLIIAPEGLSARAMGLNFTRSWHDVDNFRHKSLFGEDMIFCDILQTRGVIDSLLTRISAGRGAIPLNYDGVDPDMLLAHLQAMKAQYG